MEDLLQDPPSSGERFKLCSEMQLLEFPDKFVIKPMDSQSHRPLCIDRSDGAVCAIAAGSPFLTVMILLLEIHYKFLLSLVLLEQLNCLEWSFLLLCVASIWVHDNQLSAWMLMGGVVASRLGLWMFDLSVMQQMQESVPDSDRCVVGGVQNSLQSFMDLMQYIMGVIISNPKDFWKMMIISVAAVTVAAALYTFHTYRIRRHLFHFDKLFRNFQ